jgi:hypothetical protein
MSEQVVFSSKSSLVPFALCDRAEVLCSFVNLAIMTLEAPSISEIFIIAGRYLTDEWPVMSIRVPSATRLAYIDYINLGDLPKL